MNLHSGARSCPASRALLIERIQHGCPLTVAAEAAGISRRTAYKWIARHAREGELGLRDRSSRPRSSPTALPIESVCCIVLLRQTRMTMAQIAASLELPRATVARVLQRRGLNRLPALGAQAPPRRYSRRHPGELLHLDVKKLGRISGFYGHRITGDRRRRRPPLPTGRCLARSLEPEHRHTFAAGGAARREPARRRHDLLLAPFPARRASHARDPRCTGPARASLLE